MARSYKADPRGHLDPEDYTRFRTAKWRINDTYALGRQQNTHERNSLTNERSRSLQELARQFTQQRDGLAGGFAKRGLMNSGIWQKQLSDFNTHRNMARGHLEGAYADQLGGNKLARQQLNSVRVNALSDIDVQAAARRAAVEAMRAGGYR